MGIFDFLFRKKAVPVQDAFEPNGAEAEGVYIGYRYTATGVFGYSFRAGKTEVFNMSSPVMPNPDVYMDGFGRKLVHKHFDSAITHVPGIRRNVEDENGNVHGFYEFETFLGFRIVAEDLTVSVKTHEAGWTVYAGNDSVAEIRRLPDPAGNRFYENGYDLEPRFRVQISGTADKRLYPYILAIPMLTF